MKYSRQREAVLECLRNRHDHPSADTIFRVLRKTDPKISLGTIYRNLNLLVQLGEIKKVSAKDGSDRYDYITGEHYHFICNNCGCILDLEMEQIKNISDELFDDRVATIDSHELTFYGICKKCYKKIGTDLN